MQRTKTRAVNSEGVWQLEMLGGERLTTVIQEGNEGRTATLRNAWERAGRRGSTWVCRSMAGLRCLHRQVEDGVQSRRLWFFFSENAVAVCVVICFRQTVLYILRNNICSLYSDIKTCLVLSIPVRTLAYYKMHRNTHGRLPTLTHCGQAGLLKYWWHLSPCRNEKSSSDKCFIPPDASPTHF